jgi:methionine sulfoxide reductase catalytic subunit
MHFLKDRGFVHRNATDITPQAAYEGRRDLLKLLASGAAGVVLAT